jgi:hypothetical protein
MIRNEYIKPNIKIVVTKAYLMDSLSVIDDNPPIDDEEEILSKGAWGNIFSDDDNNTGW